MTFSNSKWHPLVDKGRHSMYFILSDMRLHSPKNRIRVRFDQEQFTSPHRTAVASQQALADVKRTGIKLGDSHVLRYWKLLPHQ
jgi:hypothetical protein